MTPQPVEEADGREHATSDAPQRGRSLRGLARQLWHQHATPLRLGSAVAVGVLVGCTPFFGLHVWIGLGLALLLRLNKLAVFLGSQISIPPLAPLLGYASVQVGARLVTGRGVHLTVADFSLSRLPALLRDFLLHWTIGGLVVGAAIALPALGVVAALVQLRRSRAAASADPFLRDLRRVTARYASAPRGHRTYVALKLRLDPVYRLVCERLGRVESVVDLGTGLGHMPLLLALRGQAQRAVGVDWDAAKIATAQAAGADLPGVALRQGDIRHLELPDADAVLLLDVLHYYSPGEQRALLQRAAAALRPGGQLIVRETDREARSALTRAMELLAVRCGWNRGPGLSYRTADELRGELRELGLHCDATEASSAVHRGNILLWGRRAPDDGG
jgi:uncharacterized protein (DUF2062 family)/SAM-dependent methyltransferase